MKKLIISGALIAACLMANAEPWSLRQCIDYALANNLTVMQRQAETTQAENELTAARDGVLPTVSANAQQSWNFGRGLTASNTYADRNTSNFGWSVGLNLPLFQGLQNVRQVSYQRTWLAAAVENLEAAKDDVTLQIMAQYLQVLYCTEMEQIASAQAAMTADELNRRQALLDAGRIPEADMLDAKSQDAQARVQLVTAQNDTRLALLDLTQILRLPPSDDFSVVIPAADEPLPTLIDPQYAYDCAMGRNHAVAAGKLQVEAAAKQVKVAQSGWIPRLSFSAGIGSNYYAVSGYDNEKFGPQMRHNFAQQLGLTLQVPIFDAFSTRNSVRRAKVSRLNTQLSFESTTDNLYKAINQTYYQAVGARERYSSGLIAVESSLASLNAIQEKYGLGRATPVEFDNAKNTYIRSLSECAQAKYELLLRAQILEFYAKGGEQYSAR